MAESASTGNSGTGTTGTTGNSGTTGTTGNGGTGTTSTSNSGPAASGSQTSSNGSFSTGNGNNGTSDNGTTGNNGKGKGPGSSIGDLGVKGYGPNGEKGTWAHTITPDSNGNHTVTAGPDGKYTVHATFFADPPSSSGSKAPNKEPVMTVDEVYGKNNQSIVENQGDYEASSNEKSNVETSTFGKQDEISVTPVSVTKDEGLVNNDAIQSVEGLNFQQKDKANQEVMEAKKSRDDAEAEDNADGMRAQLKSVAEKDAEETDAFQVGEKNTFEEQNNAKLNELNKLEKGLNEVNKDQEKTKNAILEADKKVEEAKQKHQEALSKKSQAEAAAQDFALQMDEIGDGPIDNLISFGLGSRRELTKSITKMAEAFDIEVGDLSKVGGLSELKAVGKKVANEVIATFDQRVKTAENELTIAQKQQEDLKAAQNTLLSKAQALEAKYDKANQEYTTWKTEYWTNAEKAKAEEKAAEAKVEEAPTTETPAYKGVIGALKDEINNSKDLTDEQKAEADTVLGKVESAADAVNEAASNLAANPNDANAVQLYVEATAKYNKALREAKGDKTLKNTDFNRTFTRAVAAANDFDVTMTDGSKKSYAEFAAEMAVKSPELAKAMYEARAKEHEENGHKVLAAIANAKSKMVMTWLGSKFTFADNQVRNQFNQMAKTDMRATYAAYNNVLSDPNATPEQKAEAFGAIQQAKSLMTASTALQVSTGFFSGIGDGTSDGVYGTTDPGKLNGYQEALNTASNFAKIALGFNVAPLANKAYQNMYYLAGDKVNESGLFSKDFGGDGFALCQEYGNNAAVGMITGAGELAYAVALMFNPATFGMGIRLAIDSVQTFFDGLYGVQKEVNKSIKYSSEVLNYFNEAKGIVAETGNKEATGTMDNAIKQIEDFQLKSDEVGNLDNWLEGSGSNTADNGKFNQALSYDEWLKLIEADPVMQEYAKSLNR